MRHALLASTVLALLLGGSVSQAETPASGIEVKEIWKEGKHNAFTDLIHHQGKWFCVFREGAGHVSPDGALRVLTSNDGETWTSAALVTMPETDLRDAKISVTPEGKLMLCGAGVTQPPKEKTHQTYIWLSDDGHTWSAPHPVGDLNYWLWRITWHDGEGYGIGYNTKGDGKEWKTRLYHTQDGKTFETLVPELEVKKFPNEASIAFQPDGTALCVLRRDNRGGETDALLGTAKAPYKEWTWKNTGVQIGGPQLLRLNDGTWIVSGRGYPGGAKTKIWKLDPATAQLTELMTLPSGGDTSYPGLVQKGDTLWVSYYSSHEKQTRIYLAKIPIKTLLK